MQIETVQGAVWLELKFIHEFCSQTVLASRLIIHLVNLVIFSSEYFLMQTRVGYALWFFVGLENARLLKGLKCFGMSFSSHCSTSP